MKRFIKLQWENFIDFKWNDLFDSIKHLIDGTLSADSCRWRVSRV